MRGSANVENLNLSNGTAPGIEKKAIFIGAGDNSTNIGLYVALNQQSDLDTVLGAPATELKTQIQAAMLNGGPDWQATSYVLDAGDPSETIATILSGGTSSELAILCDPSMDTPENLHTTAMSVLNSTGRRVAILSAVATINPATQTWTQYITALAAVTNGVIAGRVVLVPQTHGNNLGVLAGRLCRGDVSVADSPMRTKTGAVLGLGSSDTDSNDKEISDPDLAALDAALYTVVQEYADKPGTFFSDANLIEDPSADIKVLEHLRLSDKAGRAIRLLMLASIADRSINNTPAGEFSTRSAFSKPLRDMSESVMINDIEQPAEIENPKDDAITINWPTADEINLWFELTPLNSPKKLRAGIFLTRSEA